MLHQRQAGVRGGSVANQSREEKEKKGGRGAWGGAGKGKAKVKNSGRWGQEVSSVLLFAFWLCFDLP